MIYISSVPLITSLQTQPPSYVFKTDDASYLSLSGLVGLADGLTNVPRFVLGETRDSYAVVKVSSDFKRERTVKNEVPSYMYNGYTYPKMVCGAGKKMSVLFYNII